MKKSKNTIAAFSAWTISGVVAVTYLCANTLGLRINASSSAPTGLWRISKIEPSEVRKGMIVSVCAPAVGIVSKMRNSFFLAAGDCELTKTEPLLKPIAAVAGDEVVLRAGQPVLVNGISIPNSKARKSMPAWTEGTYRVPPGQVWLISSFNKNSFDSRYFGAVPVENIRGQASPIWIKGNFRALTEGQ